MYERLKSKMFHEFMIKWINIGIVHELGRLDEKSQIWLVYMRTYNQINKSANNKSKQSNYLNM